MSAVTCRKNEFAWQLFYMSSTVFSSIWKKSKKNIATSPTG